MSIRTYLVAGWKNSNRFDTQWPFSFIMQLNNETFGMALHTAAMQELSNRHGANFDNFTFDIFNIQDLGYEDND